MSARIRKDWPTVSARNTALIAVATFFGTILMVLYVTPLILNGLWGIGFFPVQVDSVANATQQGDMFITQIVSADKVHVGDELLMWDRITGSHFSRNVVSIAQLFDGIRFTTAGFDGHSTSTMTYIAGRFDVIPVVFATVPFWGGVVEVIYSPQFQAGMVFLIALSFFIFLMRLFPRQRPGITSSGWSDE